MERAPEARALALPLIGRSAEIARIGGLVERAADRGGLMLMLAGPAGIGKSRLVREALTVAAQRGFVTLSGSARVLGQGLAYAPVLEALGPYLAALPPGRRVRLLDGLPDLGRLFIDLHLPPAALLGDPARERTRLFEAVARLLGRLAEQAPVALALDDLHWADTATVELLHYLARGVGDRRMLLVGAYRTDEAEVEPALRALVRDVRRAGVAEELPLAGLTAAGVQSLARAMLGGDPPPALVSLLTVRAAGSPLVVTALIGELLAGGGLFRSGGAWALGPGALDTVPAAVRDLVLGYLQRLTTQERGLLELVAVAGDAAMPPVLADVVGADEERVLAGLRRLRDLGLVAEVTEGWGLRDAGTAAAGLR
jgi:predicted ATPase